MSNLRSRALEGEFCDIVRDLGGDAEGRAAGEAYLDAAHPIVGSDDTVTWALTPKIFGPAELSILSDAAETMGRILQKVTARFLKDPDFRALFHLPERAEELALVPTGYDELIPFARIDVIFNEETGDFRLAGVSTDSALGVTASVDVTRAIQRSEAYRRFSERHRSIETFDIAEGVISALRETYQSWANSDEGTNHPEHPVVGIVDYAESATSHELDDLIERMADEGVYARFVDIRDLRIEEAGGVRRLVDGEGPIACVYRRALVGEMLEKPCAGVDALEEAARRGLVCLIGGFRTWPVSTNALFPVLNSEAIESVLDPAELAFVRAHVPEAHVLERGSDINRYLAEQDEWLVRPAGAYRAPEVVAGEDRVDRDEWWRVLLACCEEGGVVERLTHAPETPLVVGGAGEEASTPIMAGDVLGLYLFRGKFGGVYARSGYAGVMGKWGHRVNRGCLVVNE